METGSTIQAAVLDVSKTERLVDLSLKPELVDNCKGKSSSRPTTKKVNPLVQFYLKMYFSLFILLLTRELKPEMACFILF